MDEAAVYCNPYDFSRPLDALLFSEHRHFKTAIDYIIEEVQSDLGKGFKQDQKTYKQQLKLVVLNCFEAWHEHQDLWVGFSRDAGRYCPGTRNAKLFIRYRPLVNCIETLEQHGYIETKIGYHDQATGKGRQSRMRATDKLIQALLFHNFERQMIERKKDVPVVMRDSDKNQIEIEVNSTLKRKQAKVNRINKFLDEQEITFNPTPEAIKGMWQRKITKPNLKRKQLVRIFNESFNEGGRFYRHWCQGLPKEYRRFIRINGHQVTELDYSSIHPYILYAKHGLPMPDEDMYSVEGMAGGNENQRKICKTILLTIFNVRPDQDPVKAVMSDLHKKGIRTKRNEIVYLIEKLKEKHHSIKKYFGSGIGRKLQKIDSDIAERIMLELMKQNVPCLPVHDSFVAPAENRDVLRVAMIQEAKAVTGLMPRVTKVY